MNETITQIANKIIEMAKVDQELRMAQPIDFAKVAKIDEENRKEIKNIVNEYGFISISKFGKDASYKAWLLVQHFPPEEIEFMENYLKMMGDNKGDYDTRNYAYLIDRINVYKGKPQIYGTQTTSKDNSDTYEFQPIKDIENIDALRREMNLSTLREYAELMEDMNKKRFKLPDGYTSA